MGRRANGTPTSTSNGASIFRGASASSTICSGSITGARHGITGNEPITINNGHHHGPKRRRHQHGHRRHDTVVNNSGTIIGISVEGAVRRRGRRRRLTAPTITDPFKRVASAPAALGGLTVGNGTINNYADGMIEARSA
jgi:hypothetical protein